MIQSIRHTPELARVRDLPRRVDAATCVDLVAELTQALSATNRCPGSGSGPHNLCDVCGGPTVLRPIQALALHDILVHGGLFGSIGLGDGKTLILLLAAYLLDCKRPLLLLPANLIEKTMRDIERYAKHWLIVVPRLFSYDMLGKVQSSFLLEGDASSFYPDGVFGDEAHRLKNRKAAVTRRVERYLDHHLDVPCVFLSGTMMSKSMLEFGHIVRWCTKREGAPVPATQGELAEWASALDVSADEAPQAPDPGALLALCNDQDKLESRTQRQAARKGFRRRLVETPGVVATAGDGGERVDSTIHVTAIQYKMQPTTEEAWEKVRAWKAPADDYDLISGADVWKHAKALAIGLTYVWNPRPPPEWLTPRRNWGAFVRKVLSTSRKLDSPEQVEQAVLAGQLVDDGLLQAWLAVRDTFEPNVEDRWHDDTVLQLVHKWGETKPGLVWVEHRFFAQRLAAETGWSYFVENGFDSRGRFVDDVPTDTSIIISMDANKEGRNLQHWSRNLIVSLKESPGFMHQLFGRTHRSGQTADEVTYDVLLGCVEHDRAWRKCLRGAAVIRDTTGQESKLLQADAEWPDESEVESYVGPRWGN